jgi:hypothetical protein
MRSTTQCIRSRCRPQGRPAARRCTGSGSQAFVPANQSSSHRRTTAGRVSDGPSSVYIVPWEFDAADERDLRVMLVAVRARSRPGKAALPRRRPMAEVVIMICGVSVDSLARRSPHHAGSAARQVNFGW